MNTRRKQVSKLIFGIISTVLALISWIVLWWLSIAAIACGITGLVMKPDTNPSNDALEKAGTVLSIIGLVVAAVGLIIFIISITVLS